MAEAKYTPNVAYPGNPLIEALPPQLTPEELWKEFYRYDDSPVEGCSANERRALAYKRLRNMYIPMDFVWDVYRSIYEGLWSAYDGWDEKTSKQHLNKIGTAIQKRNFQYVPDAESQAQSMALLGESGVGKTRCIDKIFSKIDMFIRHTEEYGAFMKGHIQIPYIKVQCPQQNTSRGLCMQILQEVDQILGTNMLATEAKSNVDMLIARIAAVCVKYSVGIIVVDEIQNIIHFHSKNGDGSSQIIRFLVELSNKSGVCICCVGTMDVAPFFDREPHLMRRTRGPRIKHFENDDTFQELCRLMIKAVPLLHQEEVGRDVTDTIYKYTCGIFGNMQRLISEAAAIVIGQPVEKFTPELIKTAACRLALDGTKRKLSTTGQDAHFLMDPNGEKPKITKTIKKSMPASPPKQRGRPKVNREEDDLLIIYTKCKERGIPVARYLLQHELAQEVKI